MLSEDFAHRFEAGVDRFQRHRIAETYVPLALSAKDYAGNRGDVRLFQKQGGDVAAVLVDFFDVGKCVEGARRQIAFEAELR